MVVSGDAELHCGMCNEAMSKKSWTGHNRRIQLKQRAASRRNTIPRRDITKAVGKFERSLASAWLHIARSRHYERMNMKNYNCTEIQETLLLRYFVFCEATGTGCVRLNVL